MSASLEWVIKVATFADQITAFAKKAQAETLKEFQKKVLQLWINVVSGTPRDTGLLRSNWQVGSSQNNNLLDPFEGVTGKARAQRNTESLRIDHKAIVYNNVSYASFVENGLGPGNRTPARMVARAIAKMEAMRSVGR